LVDGLIVFVVLVGAGALVGLDANFDAAEAGDAAAEQLVNRFYTINFIAQLLYYWVWNSVGWSPGKRALRLRIVTESGGPPGFARGFARTVGSVISALPVLLGYLWMLWDSKRQTWHDKMAGTFVVREGDSPR